MSEPDLPPRVQRAIKMREFRRLLDMSSFGPIPASSRPLPDAIDEGEWCAFHQQYEKDEPGDYKSCGECCHIWRTEHDFVDDVLAGYHTHVKNAPHVDGAYPGDPREHTFCPLCTHDF